MNGNLKHTGLILLSGVDAPGITEMLFQALTPFQIEILDFEQVVIRDRLLLTILIKFDQDRKSTRLNSSHVSESRMPSSA